MAGPRHLDLIGQRFGRLTVSELVGNHPTRSVMVWKCICDCGKSETRMTDQLRQGKSPSCGCWGEENRLVASAKKNTIHGMSKTPTGISWVHMISRCYNKSCHAFKNYGGRGILACDFIKASPINIALTIGERPKEYTLDRIKNNLGYLCGVCAQCQSMNWPLNIRWATRKEQNRNTRGNVFYKIGDEVKCGAEWAEETGVPPLTISRKWKHLRVNPVEVSSG